MDFAEWKQYLHWPIAFLGVAVMYRFQCWLISLAKRHLPRGSRIRRLVLWSRANEPD